MSAIRHMLARAALTIGGVGALATGTAALAQATASPHTYATRYDAVGRTVGTIAPDPDGAGPLKHAATRTTYDVRGNPIKVETGELASWQSDAVAPSNWPGFTVFTTTETTYDLVNRKTVERVMGSDGVTISLMQYSYDAAGRPECTAVRMNPAVYGSLPASACILGPTGSQGPDRITRTVYDAAGQVLQVRKAVGTPIEIVDVTYSYTTNGKTRQVVDANGNRAELRYDGHDRQTRWVFPSKTRPVAFNPATPVSAITSAGALNEANYEEYAYDANGNRLWLRKRDGRRIAYTYDALNRVTVKDVCATGGAACTGLAATHIRDVFYEYDLRGLQTKARFGSLTGVGITYAYDGFGRLISETQNTDGVTRTVSSQYNANGSRTRVTYPDGQFFTYDHDGLDRATVLREGTTQLGTATFNNRGLPTQMAWTALTASANTRSYGYDNAGRLNAIGFDLHGTVGDVSWGYTRNPASQILSESQSNDSYAWDGFVNLTRAYTTNGLNQYESAGSAAFCYDANGNLTADGSSVYLYDFENRLVEKRAQGTGNTNCAALSYAGALQAQLLYDPTGRLYQVSGGASGIQRFAYDGNAMIAEYNGSNVMLRRYVHGSNAEADDPLIWYEGATQTATLRRYLHSDPRGSIVAVTDHTGNRIATNTYDEYGIPDTASGNDPGSGPGAGIATKGRFRYTGQAWIPELGMYYYKARIYSPTLGRFLQTDPIGYEDQFNLYSYAWNDPINGVDPTGNENRPLDMLEGAILNAPAALEETLQSIIDVSGGNLMDDPDRKPTVEDYVNVALAVVTVVAPEAAAARASTAGRTASRAARRCCFVAGTLVDTENGLRAIEEINVGDKVWARDEDTGETALKEVTNLIQRHERVIWEVSLTGPNGEAEKFETTDDHPWWIAGQGWKRTEELVAGMAVVTRDGRGMMLISAVETDRTDATYNLTVADFETYFVGEQRVLVHNCPPGSYTNHHESGRTYDGKGDSSRAAASGRRIAREQGDPVVRTETRTASSDRESFKQESRSLDANGGPRSNRNYNQIESPGKRMRREDGEID